MSRIRPFSVALLVVSALCFSTSNVFAGTPSKSRPELPVSPRVPGVVYAQFRSSVPDMNASAPRGSVSDKLAQLLRFIGVTNVALFDSMSRFDATSRKVGIDRMVVINYAADIEPLTVMRSLLALSQIESASPRYKFTLANTPNDPGSSSHYAWTKLDLYKAWDVSKGDSTVIIADCDEGTNYNHDDLRASVKINWGESGVDKNGKDKRTNGIDDDGDGAKDNWHGWDVVGKTGTSSFTPDNDPIADADANAHGTLTAGCISATANNGIGLAGSGYLCKLLPIKIANAAGDLVGGYEGIHYAATHGARIINCSWGGPIDAASAPFAIAFITEVTARDALVVAASGNFAIDNDITPFYPSSISDVLSVGATGSDDKAASFTQFGHSVKVYAPGVQIYTTSWPGNSSYQSIDGTSFSSPLTAGIVGLLMSKHPDWPVRFIVRQIVLTCDNVVNPANRTKYWGRVNANAALTQAAGPGLLPLSYQLDGVTDGTFPADLKNHTLKVNFRNAVTGGTNLTATLVDNIGYHTSNSTASLGSMGTYAEKPANYTISRTGAISEGTLNIRIALTDGGSYIDTIALPIALENTEGAGLALTADYGSSISVPGLYTGFATYGYEAQSTIQSKFSTNSGAWSNPEPLGPQAPYCVEATTADRAFVGTGPASGSAVIYSTGNGGSSWTTKSVSTITNFVNSIHFFDAQHGIFIGDPLANKWGIGLTSDGGASWHEQSAKTNAVSGEASWNNSACWVGQNGWFGTNKRRIWRTNDGGETWKVATVPYTNCLSIGFANDTDGIASFRPAAMVGSTSVTGQAGLLVTHDGGATWSTLQLPEAGMTPANIQFIPNTKIAFMASDRGILRTDDFGTTWSYLGVPSSYDPGGAQVGIGREGDTYYVSVLSQNGIADYADNLPPTQSVHSENVALTIATYPNPSTDRLHISLASARDAVKMELYSVAGASVYSRNLTGTEAELSIGVSELPSGTYTLALRMRSGESARKTVTVVH